MPEPTIILTTVPNKETADSLSQKLLSEGLVACIQKLNIESSYLWKGEIANDNEILLLLKTRKDKYSKVEEVILNLHPYEVPEIIEVDINRGLDAYFDWMNEVLNQGE